MERPPMETALSTDVVMDIIMSHLNVEYLLDCRLVSKFWNKAASSVLRRRSTMIKNISETKTLKELEECLEQSSDFPFAGLKFHQPWELSYADAIEFFKKYGATFTSLYLGTWRETRLEDLAPFINHLPRLSILELDWSYRLPPEFKLSDSVAGQEDGRTLNLPSLRTCRISWGLNEDVIRAVSTAASPSLRIECTDATYENLKALQRVGKLQAVSVLNVDEDEDEEDHALRVDELLSTETPALHRLDFDTGGCISRNGLMKLLISSQKTLKELRLYRICPAEFLTECPVLTKLTSLRVCISDGSYESVFQGSHGHKFPALQELTLGIWLNSYTANFQLSDGLFIVPSLKKIDLIEFVEKAGIEALARSFPNVIEIQLLHEPTNIEKSRKTDPFDIWSVGAFKFLEKLKIWDCTVQSPTKIFDTLKHSINFNKFKLMNMDSFLTGMSIGVCENLRKQPRQNLMGSPFNEILRDSPSLLQLENLKELIVCVRLSLDDDFDELPEEPPFISMVSVWYALQMMPNLVPKFVYEDRFVKGYIKEEDREKAVKVLKSAFKHVKPYVELEPCYC